jgi:hypothetical protein
VTGIRDVPPILIEVVRAALTAGEDDITNSALGSTNLVHSPLFLLF